MHVTVRLFAGLRERAGTAAVSLELAEGARVCDALAALADVTAGSPVVMAVNHEYADARQRLRSGDELALIPPVSGGAEPPRTSQPARVHARVRAEALSLDSLLAFVRDPRAGAVVTFAGVTREVPALQYEAYAEMAQTRMEDVARAAADRHGLCAAAIEHRTGTVMLSEASVLIAASAPHRAEAFAGAREIIDRVKELAPIWKKEEGVWQRGALPRSEPRAGGSAERPADGPNG